MQQLKLKGIIQKKRGRKRIHSPGVAHTKREKVIKRHPLHVNFKLNLEKGSLRTKTVMKFMSQAVAKARRQGLGVVHFCLEHNHIHLLLEAQDNQTLTRGMRALAISLVMRLNHHWKKGGQRLKERYHLHVLKSLREVRHAYRYVRQNHIKHTGELVRAFSPDIFSSFSTNYFEYYNGELDPPQSWMMLKTVRSG